MGSVPMSRRGRRRRDARRLRNRRRRLAAVKDAPRPEDMERYRRWLRDGYETETEGRR